MDVFAHREFDSHENVVFAHDRATGLRAIVAIHSTRLGPATGGCRVWRYSTNSLALEDALRLSRGMTYKNAIAGLDLGGGKAVILLGEGQSKSPELMRAFGRAVEQLAGRYITAEDVGATAADMAEVRTSTRFVAGLADGRFASGEPGPITAQGVFNALEFASLHRLRRTSLQQVTVAVQGLGSVGMQLCHLLHQAGARLIVTDPNRDRVAEAAYKFGASLGEVDGFHRTPCDVYAPCALGGGLDAQTIPDLGAAVVAGAANNQLKVPENADDLHQRGILYLPDFMINAGGIISVAAEIAEVDRVDWVARHMQRLQQTIQEVVSTAEQQDRSPHWVALDLAQQRLQKPASA